MFNLAAMNPFLIRTFFLVVHIVANIALVSYLVNFDLGESSLRFVLFILIMAILVLLFAKHLISFIQFIKSH